MKISWCLLALSIFGCGSDGNNAPSRVNVMLALEESCAGGVTVGCASTLWVGSEVEGTSRTADCTQLQPATTIRSLGGILSDSVELGELPADRAVRIRVGIYEGELANGCPQRQPTDDALVFGTTGEVIFGEGSSATLTLSCAPIAGESCSQVCDRSAEGCISETSYSSCADFEEACPTICSVYQVNECSVICATATERCREASPIPIVEATPLSCAEICGPEGRVECVTACEDVEDAVSGWQVELSSCQTSWDSCRGNCESTLPPDGQVPNCSDHCTATAISCVEATAYASCADLGQACQEYSCNDNSYCDQLCQLVAQSCVAGTIPAVKAADFDTSCTKLCMDDAGLCEEDCAYWSSNLVQWSQELGDCSDSYSTCNLQCSDGGSSGGGSTSSCLTSGS